ncbi:MAG: hypothetical protein PHW33_02475 [Candidatus Portnoybacteria bacterium]|jgi:hypothetical protein|nr:hypothetical protein [Candidatus Portnoybacteria bacterium]
MAFSRIFAILKKYGFSQAQKDIQNFLDNRGGVSGFKHAGFFNRPAALIIAKTAFFSIRNA